MKVDNEQQRRRRKPGRSAVVVRQVPSGDGQTVDDLGLDVERREIGQHVIDAARQPGGRLRVDDPLEVLQVGVEMAGDVEAERQRRRENRRGERREEERDRGHEHQLDEDQEDGLQQRGIEPGASQPARIVGGSVHDHVARGRRRAPSP